MAQVRSRRQGFTLIEILCVVTILSIAALAAMPLLGNGTADVKLVASTRSIMADLFYAQNLAITTQQPVYLMFCRPTSTTGGSYWLLTKNIDGTFNLQDRPGGSSFVISLGRIGNPAIIGGTQLPDVQLGTDAQLVGAFKQGTTAIATVTLSTLKHGSTPATVLVGVLLGFDTMGQPLVVTNLTSGPTPLAANGTIDLVAPTNATVKVTLGIEPFTGEITIN